MVALDDKSESLLEPLIATQSLNLIRTDCGSCSDEARQRWVRDDYLRNSYRGEILLAGTKYQASNFQVVTHFCMIYVCLF